MKIAPPQYISDSLVAPRDVKSRPLVEQMKWSTHTSWPGKSCPWLITPSRFLIICRLIPGALRARCFAYWHAAHLIGWRRHAVRCRRFVASENPKTPVFMRCWTLLKAIWPSRWCHLSSSFSAGDRLMFEADTTDCTLLTEWHWMNVSSWSEVVLLCLWPIDTGNLEWILKGTNTLPRCLLPLMPLKVNPLGLMIMSSPANSRSRTLTLSKRTWLLGM